MRWIRWIGATISGLALALGLGLLLWPLGVSIAPVRAVDPDGIAAPLRDAFRSERGLTEATVRLLSSDVDLGRGIERHLVFSVLMMRLSVLSSVEQRATYFAVHARYLVEANTVPLAEVTRRCFGKTPTELGPSEAATLVAITRIGPTAAKFQPDRLLESRDSALRAVAASGRLNAEELAQALTVPLDICDG